MQLLYSANRFLADDTPDFGNCFLKKIGNFNAAYMRSLNVHIENWGDKSSGNGHNYSRAKALQFAKLVCQKLPRLDNLVLNNDPQSNIQSILDSSRYTKQGDLSRRSILFVIALITAAHPILRKAVAEGQSGILAPSPHRRPEYCVRLMPTREPYTNLYQSCLGYRMPVRHKDIIFNCPPIRAEGWKGSAANMIPWTYTHSQTMQVSPNHSERIQALAIATTNL